MAFYSGPCFTLTRPDLDRESAVVSDGPFWECKSPPVWTPHRARLHAPPSPPHEWESPCTSAVMAAQAGRASKNCRIFPWAGMSVMATALVKERCSIFCL